MQMSIKSIVRIVAVCFVPVLLPGCQSGEQSSNLTESAAREALDTALAAWKSGQAHGTVEGFDVPIDTFDARWQASKKLDHYEIVREEESEGPRRFVVTMKLADETKAEEVHYLVIGSDPMLIFRKQDYDNASSMIGGK